VSPDNLHVVSHQPNAFIQTGSGNDMIDVSQANGNNILDGGGGSNFLIGGSGTDTFSIDHGNLTANAWSTVVNFHSGDNLTIWGVTPADFALTWMNNLGAPGATGLTGFFTGARSLTADITLPGYTTADIGTRLTMAYGQAAGTPGNVYMVIHAV